MILKLAKSAITLITISLLAQACTTQYHVTVLNEPDQKPPSVIGAQIQVNKKVPFKRLLFFLPEDYACDLTLDNFAHQENGEFIATEAQLNIKPNIKYFRVNTILLLDNSLSIGNSNLPKLRESAKELINLKAEYQDYAIAAFSGEEELNLLCDFTSDVNVLRNTIDNITELGNNSTNLNGAISNCLEALQKQEEKLEERTDLMTIYQVVAFTDGADTQGTVTLGELNQQKLKTSYDIFPVVVKSPEIDKKALKEISTRTTFSGKGKIYAAKNFDKLSDAFIKMQEDLSKYSASHYNIEYMSPKRGDNENHFVISVEPRFKVFKIINRVGVKILGYNNEIEGDFNSNNFYSVRQGICVTVNNDFEKSETIWQTNEIELNRDEPIKAQIFSVGGSVPYGNYQYSLSNENFTIEELNNDFIVITPTGENGSTTKLIIKDRENTFEKEFTLKIL